MNRQAHVKITAEMESKKGVLNGVISQAIVLDLTYII